jgi:hypothetical protein
VKNWRGRYSSGRTAHDEFGAILSDIRRFGRTTPSDRKRLRDLARTFGWSESSVDANIITVEENRRSNQDTEGLELAKAPPI